MRKRSARGTISRESVADAALAIADRAGFDAVTMRATAAEVGATPMALYAYFSGKNALYAGMRERVFLVHVFAACVPRGTWQSTLEGIARGLYEVMRKHPNWAPVMAHHSGPASSGLSYIEESLGLMVNDGFGFDDAINAYLSVRRELRRWERAQPARHHGRQRWVCEVPLASKGAPCPRAGTLWEPSFRGGKARRLFLGQRLRVRHPVAARFLLDMFNCRRVAGRGNNAGSTASGDG